MESGQSKSGLTNSVSRPRPPRWPGYKHYWPVSGLTRTP